ncbi:MAG: right-handed parallel beta-helix repeat-containing protein [Armatimonadota bacterium]|nr:right-handed parallel beta-helix repeat-containing protein [Armatimonadota bacterium]
MRTTGTAFLVFGLLAAANAGQVSTEAVELVKAGKIDAAKASWWGFDPDDATECLQAAINSGVRTLIVDNVGKPWIVRPIQLTSNQKIIFEPGVEILAKLGEFQGPGDSLFSASNAENIELIGYGATFRMRRDDYANPPYKKAEWRMALALRSCRNVKVYGLTLVESGGDGIYLGVATKGVPNRDIVIRDVVCDRNYRQGISVISAERLLIENVYMTNTSGTAPQSGIDFEPNREDERLVDVTVRNCTTQGNGGYGYQFHLTSLKASSEPVSIRVENCRSIDDSAGSVQITTGRSAEQAVRGRIEFVACQFSSGRNQGIGIDGNPDGACAITFEDCLVENAALNKPAVSPVRISGPARGIRLSNLLVRDPLKRRPVALDGSPEGIPFEAVTGTLIVDHNGKLETVHLTPSTSLGN